MLSACAVARDDCNHVTNAIKYYVLNFFGCADCAKNFGNEVKVFPPEKAHTVVDQVLWLWKLQKRVQMIQVNIDFKISLIEL